MKLTEDNYVEIAENVIKKLREKKDQKGRQIPLVTTSKIRNLLGMTADIYNEVINSKEEKLSSELVGRINYMKIRFIYEAGREPKVKSLIESKYLTYIDYRVSFRQALDLQIGQFIKAIETENPEVYTPIVIR